MGALGLDDLDMSPDNVSTAPQSSEASPFPWPVISCVSSPYANKAGTLHGIQTPGTAVEKSPAQLFKGPAVMESPAARECHAAPPGQPPVPLGCLFIDPDSVSPALAHGRQTGAPGSPVPHAEKENTPSPEKINLVSHTAPPPAPAEFQASRDARGGIESRATAHRQEPLQRLLQQASPLASGAPAHHSLQMPASSKQDQPLKPRPASAQGCKGEESAAKQAVKAWSRHTAPEDCDPLLARFAWNLDKKGQPDSIEQLRSSGIFPEQGPLGAGQEALQRLSYSSSASAASIARHAQRIDDEANMLYMSQSSSNGSARIGRLRGGPLGDPMQSSSDSSAHPFQISLENGIPTRTAPCAAETAYPVGPLHAQMCFKGFPRAEPQVQSEESLVRSSCLSAMPWDLSRSDSPAARLPAVPRHLATPALMERAGDPTFYDEPELERTTPPAEHPPSRFTLAEDKEHEAQGKPSRPKLPPVPAHLRRLLKPSGTKAGAPTSRQDLAAASVKTGQEPAPTSHAAPCEAQQHATELRAAVLQQAARLKPATPPPPPALPAQAPKQAHAEGAQESAIRSGKAKPPPPPPMPAKAPKQAQAMGLEKGAVSAAGNGQVNLKPARPPPPPPVPAQAPRQKQGMGPHEAAMSAIRSGQFKLTPVKEPAQQTTPAQTPKQGQTMGPHEAAMSAIKNGQFKLTPVKTPAQQTTPVAGTKDALMSAIKNRQYSLKPVSPAIAPKAGADGRGMAAGPASGGQRHFSPLAGLHAMIRERTAGMQTYSESASNATSWEA